MNNLQEKGKKNGTGKIIFQLFLNVTDDNTHIQRIFYRFHHNDLSHSAYNILEFST